MSYTPVISLISISSNDNILYPIGRLLQSEPISSSASNSSNSSSYVAASTNSRISSTVSRNLQHFAYALEELMQSINKKSHSRVNYKNSLCNSTRGRLWVRAGTLELYVLSQKRIYMYYFFHDIRTFSMVKTHKESCALLFIIIIIIIIAVFQQQLHHNL